MRFDTKLIIALLFFTSPLFAQAPVNYNDVGVVVNDNDTNSVGITNYFVQKRNIPLKNVIHITSPTKETIDDTEFEAMRAQIEAYITSANLNDSLNYIVTTKGVPLRVDRGGTGGDLNSKSASVDAELMLILGPNSSQIGQATLIIPPSSVRVHAYFRKDEKFSRAKFGMYLVTRLIGLTKDDVIKCIDRSGPFTLVNRDSALFVLDQDPNPIDGTYNNFLIFAADSLTKRSWRVLLNKDSVYVTNQRNVLGYTSWGSNDHYDHLYTQYARPKNHWSPGSIAETYVSTSARNFVPGGEAGQSRIADLIAEGAIGASGYVFEPYSLAITWVHILFSRYTSGYNLAESFYMANPTMSWMAMVVGDPKTSIITSIPGVPSPTIDAITDKCQNESANLHASNTLIGTAHWFNTDSTILKSLGKPFDERHPNWVGSSTSYNPPTSVPGIYTYTFVNENFKGVGFAQATFEVKPKLKAGFTVSADTIYLDESTTVQFSDTTKNSMTWQWNFGDGVGNSTLRNPAYTYSQTGKYTVSLLVTNGICVDSTKRFVVVMKSRKTDVEYIPPTHFVLRLEQNYPNPIVVGLNSKATTNIIYQIERAGYVTIEVFDLYGRKIMTLIDGVKAAGEHSVEFNLTSLPSGTYIYQLSSKGRSISKRMTLM